MRTRSGQARLIELLLAIALVGTFIIAYNNAIGGLGVVNVRLSRSPISAESMIIDMANRGVFESAFETQSLDSALTYIINAVRVSLPTGYAAKVTIETYIYNDTVKSYIYNPAGKRTGYTHVNIQGDEDVGSSTAAVYLYLDEDSMGRRVYLVRLEIYELSG